MSQTSMAWICFHGADRYRPMSALMMSRVRTRLPPGPASNVTMLISIRLVRKIMRLPRACTGKRNQSSTNWSNLHVSLLIWDSRAFGDPGSSASLSYESTATRRQLV